MMVSLAARMIARSTVCSSSRMLPGQAWPMSVSMADVDTSVTGRWCCVEVFLDEVLNEIGDVLHPLRGRERNLEDIQTVEEVLSKPALMPSSRSVLFVAATRRTSTDIVLVPRHAGTLRIRARGGA